MKIIKYRRSSWTELVARLEEGRSNFKILSDKPIRRKLLYWVIKK